MTPSAQIILAAARRDALGNWKLALVCPLCHLRHTHDAGSGPSPVGGRRAAPCDPSSWHQLVVSQSRWHASLVDDVEWLTARLGKRATAATKARAKTGLVGLAEDPSDPPGFVRLVDLAGEPAFGLSELDVLVPASGPVAAAVGGSVLYAEVTAPWLSPARAAEYVAKLRGVLVAAAVAEAAR